MAINDPRDIAKVKIWFSAKHMAQLVADGAAITIAVPNLINPGTYDASRYDLGGGSFETVTMRHTGGPGGGAWFDTGVGALQFLHPFRASDGWDGTVAAEAWVVSKHNSGDKGWHQFGGDSQNNHFTYSNGWYCGAFSNTRFHLGNTTAGTGAFRKQRVSAKLGTQLYKAWLDAWQGTQFNGLTTLTSAYNPAAGNKMSLGVSQSSAWRSPGFSLFLGIVGDLTAGEVNDLAAWADANLDGGLAIDPDPPDVPEDLAVTPTETTLLLEWSPPSAGSGVDSYEVRIDAGAPVDVGLDLDYLFTGLDSETLYTLEVRAVNAYGESAWVDIDGTTLEIQPPEDVAATPLSTAIELVWSPPLTATPDSYEVRIDAGAPLDVGTAETYTFTALDPETLHTVAVRAVYSFGVSAWVSVEATTLEIPAGATFTVDLTIGTHTFNITNECTIDPEAPIQVLDGLEIGWSVDESDPWPAQPKPVYFRCGFWSDDVAELDDVVIGTPIAAILTDADDAVFATFHGRVAQLVAQATKRGAGHYVQYQVAGIDYTVDLTETTITLAARPAESADDRYAAIVAAAAAAGLQVTAPADTGTAAFEALSASTTSLGTLLAAHLAQTVIDTGGGPQRYIVVPVVTEVWPYVEYRCVLLDRSIDSALLPATFGVVDDLFTLVFPNVNANGLVDACNVDLSAPWVRLKYRAVNRVTVAGDTVTAEASRVPFEGEGTNPTVGLTLTTTLTDDTAAELMARVYLPDAAEANGWNADTLQLLAYRNQKAIEPAWFPDHTADPASTAVYVMPIAVVGILPTVNLAAPGSSVYAGQLTSVALRFEARRLYMDFALRRQLPVGVGDDVASAEWVLTEFPTITPEDVDPTLSAFESRLARRF